jgi:hypothetical protein
MLVLNAFVLWLVVFGLLLLFAVAFILRRALTPDFPAAHPTEHSLEGRTAPLPAKRRRPISHSPRKRWRRTPGMQSGLPPPTILAG